MKGVYFLIRPHLDINVGILNDDGNIIYKKRYDFKNTTHCNEVLNLYHVQYPKFVYIANNFNQEAEIICNSLKKRGDISKIFADKQTYKGYTDEIWKRIMNKNIQITMQKEGKELNDKQLYIKKEIKHSQKQIVVVTMPRQHGKTAITHSMCLTNKTPTVVICVSNKQANTFEHGFTYNNIKKAMRFVKKNKPCTVVFDEFIFGCNRKTYRALRAFIHECVELNVKVVILSSECKKNEKYTSFLKSSMFILNVERFKYYVNFFK